MDVAPTRVRAHYKTAASQSTEMQKVTIGDIPAYVVGDESDPGVIVIQVARQHLTQICSQRDGLNVLRHTGVVGRF